MKNICHLINTLEKYEEDDVTGNKNAPQRNIHEFINTYDFLWNNKLILMWNYFGVVYKKRNTYFKWMVQEIQQVIFGTRGIS